MKIICFSSHTNVWSFAIAEATVASVLQKKGNNVLYITPGNQFAGISNLLQEKILRKEFGLTGYEIGAVLTDQDWKEINLIMSKLTKDNFENLIIDNIDIGKIALYEFLIERKKMNFDFTINEWKECLTYLRNTLISFFACRTIINKEKPDRILMYSTVYSVNHVWEKYVKTKDIPAYFLHHGLNFSDIDNTLIVAKNNSSYYFNELKNIWFKVKNVPVPQKMLSYVTDHFLELLKAKHILVYSVPKSQQSVNIRKIFNIKDNQKILTATMSSYDEMFAAEYVGVKPIVKNLIFGSQVEWVKTLIGYVKNKKDLFLLIRVHPREFPNKRDSVRSEHSIMLEKEFRNLPDNIKVNWPTDNISIYDLAQETDVFLNAWSSVGVEMSLLGIPVVIYSKDIVLYPSDLNYVAKNCGDYFFQIERALNDGWSYEKIKMTYRWLALYYCRTIMRFRNKDKKAEPKQLVIGKSISVFSHHFYKVLPLKIKLIIAKLFSIISDFKLEKKHKNECIRQYTECVDISKVEKMLNDSTDTLVDIDEILADAVTKKEEDRAVRNELKRLYEALYGSQDDSPKIKRNSLQYNIKRAFINR